jgi:methylated-DNA-[protein]-cysteine S-methyltransferase
MNYIYKTTPTPVGELKLIASEKGLAAVLWENDDPKRARFSAERDERNAILIKTELQLREYFAGERTKFSIPLDMQGTDFQKSVWRGLLAIPFGETRSYGQLAKLLNHPRASRAVGAAIGKNPVSIIVPCHRVIGSNGKLTGFAGGLDVKEKLLRLEQQNGAKSYRVTCVISCDVL